MCAFYIITSVMMCMHQIIVHTSSLEIWKNLSEKVLKMDKMQWILMDFTNSGMHLMAVGEHRILCDFVMGDGHIYPVGACQGITACLWNVCGYLEVHPGEAMCMQGRAVWASAHLSDPQCTYLKSCSYACSSLVCMGLYLIYLCFSRETVYLLVNNIRWA